MAAFSRTWLDGIELEWSWSLLLIAFFISSLLTLPTAAIFSIFQQDGQLIFPAGIWLGIFLFFLCIYGLIYYGSEVRLWNGSISTARMLARTFARLKLMLSILTLNAPIRTEKEINEKKMISPVSFLFAENHRLSFIGGEQALANIIQSLFISAEEHFGTMAIRLFTAFKSPSHPQYNVSKLQNICGIPILLLILTSPISFAIASLLFIQQQQLAASVFLALSLVSGTAMLYLLSVRLFINLPKRRIAKIKNKLHLISFERMLQKLQKEVDLLVALVSTLDAFTNSQTRFVVMVDGLDSCEQNKMVQLLDALSLFFCSRQNAPFVVLLAIDPNIVISTIHQNRTSTGPEDEITGRDYLKNVVTMPFFLDHIVALRKMHSQQNSKKYTISNSNNLNAPISLKERIRSETFRGSRLSLRATDRVDSSGQSGGITNASEIGHLFPSFDVFANINPRTLRRIVNSIALTGRLLRTFEVDFSWWQIYAWVSLIEQWPWRMCWLIDVACSLQDDSLSLHELYNQLKGRITMRDGFEDLDRNNNEFDNTFRKLCASKHGLITVSHAKSFTPCTSNLDPYLRRVVREQRGGEPLIDLTEAPEEDEEEAPKQDPFGPLKEMLGPEAEFLFDDPMIWATVNKPLPKMSIGEIVSLVNRLTISKDKIEFVSQALYNNNLNGLALHSCDLIELRNILKVPLGDWTLIQLFIEKMRKWKPFITQSIVAASTNPGNDNANPMNGPVAHLDCRQASSSERPTPLRSIQEEDGNTSSPAPLSSDEKEKSPESKEEKDDEEDTNSLASVAGSDEQSLLLKSPSPPES